MILTCLNDDNCFSSFPCSVSLSVRVLFSFSILSTFSLLDCFFVRYLQPNECPPSYITEQQTLRMKQMTCTCSRAGKCCKNNPWSISNKCNSIVCSFIFQKDLTRRLVTHRWYVRDLSLITDKKMLAASTTNSLIAFLF